MTTEQINCIECLKICDANLATPKMVTFKNERISVFVCHSCKRSEHVCSADSYFDDPSRSDAFLVHS